MGWDGERKKSQSEKRGEGEDEGERLSATSHRIVLSKRLMGREHLLASLKELWHFTVFYKKPD
ncbi:DNA mismatch repair protein [Ascosphaera pollenicola]|nr:DNA mismatch repair protein [Ascosphaera pollenicola]